MTDITSEPQYSRSDFRNTHFIKAQYSICFGEETVAICEDQEAADSIVSNCNEHPKLLAERLYLRAAIQAIACRLAGEFDHPALMAYGPLRGSDHDIAAIARLALEKVPA